MPHRRDIRAEGHDHLTHLATSNPDRDRSRTIACKLVRPTWLALRRARDRRRFAAAESYLRADSVMARTFDDLERASTPTYVLGNHRGDDHFDFEHHAITWDAHSALRTTSGGVQSPALGLGHELVHANEAVGKRDVLASVFDAAYDNKEERRVIVGAETHAAHTLGEGTRHDHGGRALCVDSPTALASLHRRFHLEANLISNEIGAEWL